MGIAAINPFIMNGLESVYWLSLGVRRMDTKNIDLDPY
jgi:hypothetical protein